MLELLNALQPIYGPLAALLIVAIVVLGKYIYDKDKEISRLRDERNLAVAKKDEDLKSVHEKVSVLQEKSIQSANNLEKAIIAMKNESELRAKTDELKTDSIVKTLEGIQTVLINIKAK